MTSVESHRCNPRPRRRIRILGCFLLQLPLIVVASPEEGVDREPSVAVGDIAISNENPFLNLLIQPIPEKESYAENLEALRVRVDAIEAEVFKGVVEAAKSADPVGELSQARADLGESVKLLQSKEGHEPGRCAVKLRESIGAERKEIESKVLTAKGERQKDGYLKILRGLEASMEKLDGIDEDLSAVSSLTERLEGELSEIMEFYIDMKRFNGETEAKAELLETLTEKEKEWFPDRAGEVGVDSALQVPSPVRLAPMDVETVDIGSDLAAMRFPVDELFEAWRTLDLERYMAQWTSDAVKVDLRTGRRYTTEALYRDRLKQFPQYRSVGADVSVELRESDGSSAVFDVWYEMRFVKRSGTTFREKAKESYVVVKVGDDWRIRLNRDYENE
jgi:hypothetical protein